MAKKSSTHHLIPRSREDEDLDPHVSENLLAMRIGQHRALHELYSNKLPQEILEEFLGMHYRIISMETRRKICELIAMEKREFYGKEVLKSKK